MEYKFLYIDDNQILKAQGVITGLEDRGSLLIEFDNPKGDWEKERERLLSEEFKQFDGLIIDLNLEDMPNRDHSLSHYKGSTLTQELRNLSKDGKVIEIPVILLSASTNLLKYFDRTNEDLFDLIISKENLTDPTFFLKTRKELIALAKGYKQLIEFQKGTFSLNELMQYDLFNEDIRFLDELQNLQSYPAHIVSKFIIKNVLVRNGILIDEKVLAARLGVDLNTSEDWNRILEIIEKFKYRGIFSDGWSLWWARGVETWWAEEVNQEKSLRSLDAEIRVQWLIEKFGLRNLKPALPLPKSQYSRFWTICYGTNTPLDYRDGLLVIGQDSLFSWQDKHYISIDEALNQRNKNKWHKLAPIESSRFDYLKKKFPNERRRT